MVRTARDFAKMSLRFNLVHDSPVFFIIHFRFFFYIFKEMKLVICAYLSLLHFLPMAVMLVLFPANFFRLIVYYTTTNNMDKAND